jgi:hypothetical protein
MSPLSAFLNCCQVDQKVKLAMAALGRLREALGKLKQGEAAVAKLEQLVSSGQGQAARPRCPSVLLKPCRLQMALRKTPPFFVCAPWHTARCHVNVPTGAHDLSQLHVHATSWAAQLQPGTTAELSVASRRPRLAPF